MTPAGPGAVRGLVVLGGGTALAAVLGLGFQSLLAFWFGAGADTDAFFMSLSIYGFLGKFLMLSHLRALALPAYARLRAADPARAADLAGGLVGLTVAGVAAASVVLLLAAPLLVDLLAPGYEGRVRELTVALVRIRIPALLFLAGTTVAMAFLESERRFGVTISAQKVVPAAVSLALLLAVADRAGIVAVGWIGLASTVAGALALAGAARPLLGRVAPTAAARDPELRAIGRGWLTLSGSNGASLLGEWAFRVGASLLPIGLFSAVLYGRMVHDLLHAAINDSAQTVALPRFAAAVAGGRAAGPGGATPGGPGRAPDPEGALALPLREALGTLGALSLPLAALVAATAPWSVALLFGRGRFLTDGMLGPAAVSLAVFALGFLLQGLVQLLFAAAFASGRSALVNRVQLVGHVARAAALVPMVWAFSYLGLVASQVAMNALVLGLLLAWAPAGWGLRRGARDGGGAGVLARMALAVAVPAGLYLGAVAPRLPDPLALGTVGRLGVLAAVGTGWLGLYGVLALLLRLPGAGAVRARVRRSAPVAGVLTAVLLCAAARPAPAGAQTAPWGALGDAHWTLPVLEWLEARGAVPPGASSLRPVPAARVVELLRAAEGSGGASGTLAAAALGRLAAEVGGALGGGWAGAGWRGADLPSPAPGQPSAEAPAREGAALLLGFDLGRPEGGPFAVAELEAGAGGEGGALRRGGVGARLGGLLVFVGRERLRLGGGRSGALVLNPTAYLDGVLLGGARPFAAGFLGEVTVAGGAGPLPRYGAVEDPWWGQLRVTLRPTSWLRLGVSRAALVGGRFEGGTVPFDPVPVAGDRGSLSGSDLLTLLVGGVTDYDDQVAALDARASLSGLGLPVLAYGEIGWEDADRSWGDPGLIAGALWAPAPSPGGPALAFRYEYAAFGADARWCAWCDTLPAYWYRHVRFQDGWRAGGEALGHPLGGYGARHELSVAGWSSDLGLRWEAAAARVRRDRWNLLQDSRPGSAWAFEVEGGWRPHPAWEASLGWREERGREGWSARRAALAVRGFWTGPAPRSAAPARRRGASPP